MESLIQGIPPYLRSSFWKLVCQVNEQKAKYNTQVYHNLLSVENVEDEFCISKDLPRTLTTNPDFNLDPKSGENKLFNVLKAYSNFDH